MRCYIKKGIIHLYLRYDFIKRLKSNPEKYCEPIYKASPINVCFVDRLKRSTLFNKVTQSYISYRYNKYKRTTKCGIKLLKTWRWTRLKRLEHSYQRKTKSRRARVNGPQEKNRQSFRGYETFGAFCIVQKRYIIHIIHVRWLVGYQYYMENKWDMFYWVAR